MKLTPKDVTYPNVTVFNHSRSHTHTDFDCRFQVCLELIANPKQLNKLKLV